MSRITEMELGVLESISTLLCDLEQISALSRVSVSYFVNRKGWKVPPKSDYRLILI